MREISENTKKTLLKIIGSKVISIFHGDDLFFNLFVETSEMIICVSGEEYENDYDDYHLPVARIVDKNEAYEIISKEFINPSRCVYENIEGIINDIYVICDNYYCKYNNKDIFERKYISGLMLSVDNVDYVIDINQSGAGTIQLLNKKTYMNDSQYDIPYIDDPNDPNPEIAEEKYDRKFISLKI